MSRFNRDPHEPEVAQFTDSATTTAADGDDGTVNKTGTTTVGLTTADGVVIATDRRASLGGKFVSAKNVVKVEQVHPRAALTLVGSVGGAQQFIETLRSEADLYEARRRKDMSINALANLAKNFARGGPFRAIHPILGGIDDDGTHVYSIDPAGGLMKDEFTVTGSGMQLAYGALEHSYDPDMDIDEARRAATGAVESAASRDTGSGNGLALATITSDGVDIEKFEEYPDHDDL